MNKAALRARWNGLAPREKTLVFAASALVTLALLWWVALAPALATLRNADSQHRTLDAQLQQMLRLQSQAKAMQAQPRQGQDEAMRQLEAAVRQQLGVSARYSIAGEIERRPQDRAADRAEIDPPPRGCRPLQERFVEAFRSRDPAIVEILILVLE